MQVLGKYLKIGHNCFSYPF